MNDEKTFKREQKMVGRFELGGGECFVSDKNRTAHIRHQCKKTTVLSCHWCLINTGVEKMNNIKYRSELWPQDASKQE